MAKLYSGEYKITSWFGPRTLSNGDSRIHKGIDCVGINSKRIITPTNGRIVSSQMITDKSNLTWEWGNYVKMDDLNGYYLFFCHLASRAVRAGQTVDKGQFVGLEGQTGYSFGSHLHFEVRRKKDNVSIDPMDYFEILNEWELNHFKKQVQSKYGFDDSTMEYLAKHPYAVSLFEKLLKEGGK